VILKTTGRMPYYPNLKAVLRSVTASLVFTYLEIYHPHSQDASGALLRAPVTLHLDQISEDLQISRRTLRPPVPVESSPSCHLFQGFPVLSSWESPEKLNLVAFHGNLWIAGDPLRPRHSFNLDYAVRPASLVTFTP